jgi:hypothetical protein
MATDEFVYRGDLAVTPVPEMLATVHRYGVPGVMEFVVEDDVKRVFFFDGDVIFATSSNRGESLGEYLLSKGRISQAQYEVSLQEMMQSKGVRHGAVLVQLGFLTQEELGVAVRDQVQHILWSLFNSTTGKVAFRVGRFREEEVYKINIPTPRAILSGCKRISESKLVTARLGGRKSVFARREWPPHLEGFQLEPNEHKLLDLVDRRRTLFELCEQGPMSAGINARVLLALFELGIIGREETAPGHIKIQVRSSQE